MRRRRSFKIREVFLSEPESDHCGVVLWRLDWCQGLKSWLLDYFEDVDVFSSDVEHDVEEAFCNSLVIDDNFAATYLQFGRDWNCLVTTCSRIVVVAVWQLLGNSTQLSGPLCHWQCLGIWHIIYDTIWYVIYDRYVSSCRFLFPKLLISSKEINIWVSIGCTNLLVHYFEVQLLNTTLHLFWWRCFWTYLWSCRRRWCWL